MTLVEDDRFIPTPKELLGMGINRGNHPKIGERRIQESLRIPRLGCQLNLALP